MILIIIILCLLGRAINIIICSYLVNIPRSPKTYITPKKQVKKILKIKLVFPMVCWCQRCNGFRPISKE